jgi:Ca2+-binding EF-hand superfamily protein
MLDANQKLSRKCNEVKTEFLEVQQKHTDIEEHLESTKTEMIGELRNIFKIQFSKTDVHSQSLRRIFDRIDVDRKGFISREEFKTLFKWRKPAATEEELDHLLEIYDENNDGQIDFDEFTSAVDGAKDQ